MALYVYKFGGTSVGTVERIKAVAEKVKKAHDLGDRIIVVVSAMSGETNRLGCIGKRHAAKPQRAGNGRVAVNRRAGHRCAGQHGFARTGLRCLFFIPAVR